jgi:hypothetical protein
MTPDMINGSFEFLAGIMNLINVRRLYIDKEIKGYSPWVFGFFTAWGVWNLYYYPFLEQWVSFFGGVVIMISNTAWLSLAIYYHFKRKVGPWSP